MLQFVSLFVTLASHVGDIGKGIETIKYVFVVSTEVEATGQTGSQKLAAVLNSTETFLSANFPDIEKPFETIAPAIESIVNLMVQAFNMFAKPAAKV